MAHPDLDELLNNILSFAQQMLAKYGEFYPFGAAMNVDGEIAVVGADSGDARPQSQDVIDLLTHSFRSDAAKGTIRAAGIGYDVRTIPPRSSTKTDAICVALEHQSGETVSVFLPYKKGLFGKIRYGELFAAEGGVKFFTDCDHADDG